MRGGNPPDHAVCGHQEHRTAIDIDATPGPGIIGQATYNAGECSKGAYGRVRDRCRERSVQYYEA